MTKLLIVISSDIYVRNYLTTRAFSALEENFECHVIGDDRVSLREALVKHPGFRGFYTVDARLEKTHRRLFNLLMWRNRKKSRTFLYRWLRNSQWHLIERSRGIPRLIVSFLRWLASASANPDGLLIPLLGNRVVFPISSRLLQRKIPLNLTLRNRIEQENYDAVLFPSAAFDAITVDLARVCEVLNIPSLCLIDNWDNLSSKTVFWKRPSHIGVWGPQARRQAMEIHGFAPTQIHEVGTPRFDQYFAARSKPSDTKIYEFPYVLFVGSAMPFDEIAALRMLDETVSRSQRFPAGMRIVYRPHPWQQKRKVSSEFNPRDFRKVILDTQMSNKPSKDFGEQAPSTGFQPDLSYYPSLLLNAACVVGPLTTMLLEASLCLRPVVGINYTDGVHSNTSRRYFSHFEGMESVPGFTFCEHPAELSAHIEVAVNSAAISEADSNAAMSYFVNLSQQSYSDRLFDTVKKILT